MSTGARGGEPTQSEAVDAVVSEAADPTTPLPSKQILGRFSQVHLPSAVLVAAAAGMVAAYVGFALFLRRGG